ncbi:RtcB family protein [Flavihumibacter stibioxidans]|uniref:3'-phosphate/5'-hydroxy nucleic acid ligase n=1 Tax=Flavihumibacter stibioxidans TaxID=1834163 RepID=A0ABR7M8R0_9BACT|nr:RtcB family protein [Flavihumibacter stibioxidans]MBC6491419.1 RNA-splicing ligase RtcB [Flavihumibacter stibioxidans]
MGKLTLSGKELRGIGYPESPVISIAMQVMEKHYKHASKSEALEILKAILSAPENYADNKILGTIAGKLMPASKAEGSQVSLNNQGIPFNIFGREHIEEGALHQMYQAARLPISVAGALMPDAHAGYGLPIGGVLATDNAVIPYGVGVDIGCRMCLSVFDIAPKELAQKDGFFIKTLQRETLFGSGKQFDQAEEHEVMDHALFGQLPLLRPLHGRAWKQLGTSGSGNHFVEFGVVEVGEKDAVLGIEPGQWLGLLSHSGSRSLGANIANHYTKLAKSKRRLPGEASNLAWLTLDEEEGMEYWLAMNLAGDYAAACHEVIHRKIARALGRQPMRIVENHHNFAWKEMYEGRELIVHRKGATPAGKDVLGIIPGSMTAPGFIVKGKDVSAAVFSASHGAGRKMSRSKAMASITKKEMKDVLQKHGVILIGGGLDEAPHAYKDIELVMESQRALVEVTGKFTPKIVRMDGC